MSNTALQHPRMRVVSLLPSATEILYLLGADIVGRSHECDWPEAVRDAVPALTGAHNKFENSLQMHEAVTATLQSGRGLYWLDSERLAALRPDAIVTQSLCSVCAVDFDIVRKASAAIFPPPRVIDTNPMSLQGVIADVRRLGAELGLAARGEEVAAALQARVDRAVGTAAEMAAAASAGSGVAQRKKVVFIEWTSPIFPGGHWTPQMIQLAGGVCPVNPPRDGGGAMPSRETDPSEVVAADPDLVIVAPCGLDLEATRREVDLLSTEGWWRGLRAVQSGAVVLVDGNQHFNRPGPRLVDALEWLVGLLWDRPDLMPAGFPWERLPALPPLEPATAVEAAAGAGTVAGTGAGGVGAGREVEGPEAVAAEAAEGRLGVAAAAAASVAQITACSSPPGASLPRGPASGAPSPRNASTSSSTDSHHSSPEARRHIDSGNTDRGLTDALNGNTGAYTASIGIRPAGGGGNAGGGAAGAAAPDEDRARVRQVYEGGFASGPGVATPRSPAAVAAAAAPAAVIRYEHRTGDVAAAAATAARTGARLISERLRHVDGGGGGGGGGGSGAKNSTRPDGDANSCGGAFEVSDAMDEDKDKDMRVVGGDRSDGGCGCGGGRGGGCSSGRDSGDRDEKGPAAPSGADPWVAACGPWSCAPHLPTDIEELHAAACEAGRSSYNDPETGFMVFTQAALAKRGACCANRCRHCPWGHFRVEGRPRLNRITRPALLHPTSAAHQAHKLRQRQQQQQQQQRQQQQQWQKLQGGHHQGHRHQHSQQEMKIEVEEELTLVYHEGCTAWDAAAVARAVAEARDCQGSRRQVALVVAFDVDTGALWGLGSCRPAGSCGTGAAPGFGTSGLSTVMDASLQLNVDLVVVPLQVQGRSWPYDAAAVRHVLSYVVRTAAELAQASQVARVVVATRSEEGTAVLSVRHTTGAVLGDGWAEVVRQVNADLGRQRV